MPYSKEEIPNYLYIPIEDRPSSNIGEHFERCFNFIEKNIGKYNVLVHCKAGVSRSVTVVACYLMMKFKYKFKGNFSRFAPFSRLKQLNGMAIFVDTFCSKNESK